MIKINKTDLEWAVSKGLLNQEQLDPLWSAFESRSELKSRFDLIHIIYYFGALLILFGMGWFTNEAWDLAGGSALFGLGIFYVIFFSSLAYYLYYKKNLEIAGGLVATLAVCLVPLMVFGFQKMTGAWPETNPSRYREFHVQIRGCWIYMEIGTIIAGIAMLRFIKFPFITAPIFFSLWYLSMDFASIYYGTDMLTWDQRKYVSIYFGLVILIISYFVDRKTKEDYAFWGYLFGMLAFWGGLSTLESDSELGKFIYFLINVIFVFTSLVFDRRIFIICGALGCIGYLGHLADKVFKGFLSFPIIISIIGLLVIYLGIKYEKNKKNIDMRVKALLPEFILKLSPLNRE